MVSGFLFGLNTDMDNLVQWSISCRRIVPWKVFKSIVTISRKPVAVDIPTTSLEGASWYILHVLQFFEMF